MNQNFIANKTFAVVHLVFCLIFEDFSLQNVICILLTHTV